MSDDGRGDPCPDKPCEFCGGMSSTRKKDTREFMTSWEWCQDNDVCAATIDWEKVFGR